MRSWVLVAGLCVAAISAAALPARGQGAQQESAPPLAETETKIRGLLDQAAAGEAGAQEFLALARLYLKTGAAVSAETALERATRSGAAFAQTAPLAARARLLQGDFLGALSMLRGLTLEGQALFDRLIIEGDAQFALGETDLAGERYQQAADLRPDSHLGYLGLARLALHMGDLQQADRLVGEALARNDTATMVHYTRGLIARYSGDLSVAKAALMTAVSYDSRNVLALNELAALALAREEVDAAQAFLDQAFLVTRRNQKSLYLSAVIAAKQRDFSTAHSLLNRIPALVQGYLPALYIRGLVAFEVGSFDTAERALVRVLEARPLSANVRKTLAAVRLKQNNARGALTALEPLLVDADSSLDARLLALAGAAASGAGQAGRGAAFLARAAALEDTESGALTEALDVGLRLGLAQFASGEGEQALETLRSTINAGNEDLRHLGLLANMHLRRGETENAMQTADRMIEIAPDRALGYNVRGSARHQARNYAAAVADYSAALERNASYFTARRNRALALQALQRWQEARADLEVILAQQPADGRARAMLGRALLAHGNVEEALEALTVASVQLDGAAEVQVDLARAFAADGKTARAIRLARDTLGAAEDDPALLRALGIVLLDLGEPSIASRALSRYLAFDPQSVDANRLYGRALYRSKLYTGARIALDRAIALAEQQGTSTVDLEWYRTAALVGSGRAQAIETAIAQLDPERRPADIPLTLIADLHLAMDDPASARAELERLYSAERDDIVAVRIADVLDQLGEAGYATRFLDQHIADQPSAGRAIRLKLADRHFAGERYRAAGQLYEDVLGVRGADAEVTARLALCYLAQGRRDSVTVAERAWQLAPNNPQVLDAYGWTLLQAERDFNRAITALETAARRAPAVAVYRFHLGMAYLAAGRDFQGVKALREALALDPDFPGHGVARGQLSRYDD